MSNILNDENFEKEIVVPGKLVIVDFFATWCEPCNILGPILENVAEELKDTVVLFKVDVDNAPIAATKYNIDRIPSVFLFKDGKPISNFIGMSSAEDIKKWVDDSAKNAGGATEPDIKGFIEESDKHAKENGFRLNPDSKAVERVAKGVFANEAKHGKKYCPCRRVTGDVEEDAKKICPCAYHKDEIEKDGHCLCYLFVK